MDIFEGLRKKGYRITSQRKEILSIISSHPKTASEIFADLKGKGILVDLASVYRSLIFFINEGLVSEVEFGDGKKRYELVKEDHHHHIVCNSCGDVEDISLKHEKQLLEEISQKSQFQIDKHSLEFFGLCRQCQ